MARENKRRNYFFVSYGDSTGMHDKPYFLFVDAMPDAVVSFARNAAFKRMVRDGDADYELDMEGSVNIAGYEFERSEILKTNPKAYEAYLEKMVEKVVEPIEEDIQNYIRYGNGFDIEYYSGIVGTLEESQIPEFKRKHKTIQV